MDTKLVQVTMIIDCGEYYKVLNLLGEDAQTWYKSVNAALELAYIHGHQPWTDKVKTEPIILPKETANE